MTDEDFEESKINLLQTLTKQKEKGFDAVALRIERDRISSEQLDNLLNWLVSIGYQCLDDGGYILHRGYFYLKIRWGDRDAAMKGPYDHWLRTLSWR